MIERAASILTSLVPAWRGELLECSGEADHLHALLDVPPAVRPSELVNNLKTVTSRRLRAEFPALRAAYRRPVLWSPSYCLLSAGGAPIDVLKRYIEGQDKPD
jgi:putative transposase